MVGTIMFSTIVAPFLLLILAISADILAAALFWASWGAEPTDTLIAGVARSTKRWPFLIIASRADYFLAGGTRCCLATSAAEYVAVTALRRSFTSRTKEVMTRPALLHVTARVAVG